MSIMKDNPTPIRQQYLRIKQQYPHAILFFRLGDFYETFDDDAKITARELEIVLTSRSMGKNYKIPMAGIPYHAVDDYLAKLIKRGYKVAICEQMTKPGETKGIVERDVVRLVTPGTVVEPGLLEGKVNNYLASIIIDGETAGIAYVDITTSEFSATQLPLPRLSTEMQRLQPAEIVIPEDIQLPDISISPSVSHIENYRFELEVAKKTLLDHFETTTLDGYGCSNLPLATQAAGAVLYYLKQTQKRVINQITHLSTYSPSSFMALDATTQANLELFRNTVSGTSGGSLLSVIDLTKTSMGGRMLKRRLGQPLLDLKELTKRQNAIGWFLQDNITRRQIIDKLGEIADLERLTNRIRANIALPQELIALKHSLEIIPELIKIFESMDYTPVDWLKGKLRPQPELIALIAQSIEETPTSTLGEGGVIKQGFSEELDKMRLASKNARKYLADIEKQEREKTGIKSLKVGYNRVFGYYIEVSQANLQQVPDTYIRKQTLVNGERFFTPELKEYESVILNAKDRITELETDIYRRICQQAAGYGESLLALADTLAEIDVFSALAEVASRNNYIKPELNEENAIFIKQGRHPVVEISLRQGEFIPNDITLSNDDSQLIILTGPNMAGKSTYLKQVAIIVLMAQIGSYVPAEKAVIGLVDRIFTRIGAREDLASGQSTFMVEMVETANILNNATPKSLLILDEIGRGTSTYDGMAIARSVVEYIHNYKGLGAKTLFATHYHELVQLADYLPRVRNFNVAVAEEAGNVIFLHRIVPGGVDKSYGIHVAKLAGLPKPVIHRADEVLEELEANGAPDSLTRTKKQRKMEPVPQLSFFGQKPEFIEELEKLDINVLTPLEALNKLYELQKKARG
ncbi:MAG: DNA mismatch repair protein MutS [Dehalococcoidales bacterium]|jgi:DNA mismatch repair protein MutS|nr:DNA mismatch repair protein MutS [Dehalococcoidales bacterium]